MWLPSFEVVNVTSSGLGFLCGNLSLGVVGFPSLDITGAGFGLLRCDLSLGVMRLAGLEVLDVTSSSLGLFGSYLCLCVVCLTLDCSIVSFYCIDVTVVTLASPSVVLWGTYHHEHRP